MTALVGALHAAFLPTICNFLCKSYSFVGFFVQSYRNVAFLFSQENLLIFLKFFKRLINSYLQACILY